MPIEFRKRITREMLQAEPNTLFVFGDNLQRRGFGGQAKEMRGEPNAVGLPTKRAPHMYKDAFLMDTDLETIRRVTQADLRRLLNCAALSGTIVWPRDGIGTGLAALGANAPAIKAFYDGILERLKKT